MVSFRAKCSTVNAVDFFKIRRNYVNSGCSEFKIRQLLFTILEFLKIKNSEKYVKKLGEILRSLVKKNFQIDNVCVVKI
jgi:hypothetical protein